jgi:hypothetical protein
MPRSRAIYRFVVFVAFFVFFVFFAFFANEASPFSHAVR